MQWRESANLSLTIRGIFFAFLSGVLLMTTSSGAAELTVNDFSFDQPLGSAGTRIEQIAENHFLVKLGHAPQHTDWNNKLQFKILRNAKGKQLRLDVVFEGGDAYIFNEYYNSWSYDGINWTPIQWQEHSKDSQKGDTLFFPVFNEDVVYVGHQTPMSYEDSCSLIEGWRQSPYVSVHPIGESLGGRMIQRITITDPRSPHDAASRWVHYFANQHPGEHNSQWRMAGMVDWLLSDEAVDARKRSICHFIMMMSPDGPSNGWYRVNGQGVDMNRSYKVDGAGSDNQAHEAALCQKDLESLMASDSPVVDLWSMHTWGGIVEPIVIPGPEMGSAVGPWTDLRDLIESKDSENLVKPLAESTAQRTPSHWTCGPHLQFGITAVLCEGGGAIYTKEEHIKSGVALIRGVIEYYKGVKQ